MVRENKKAKFNIIDLIIVLLMALALVGIFTPARDASPPIPLSIDESPPDEDLSSISIRATGVNSFGSGEVSGGNVKEITENINTPIAESRVMAIIILFLRQSTAKRSIRLISSSCFSVSSFMCGSFFL